MLVGSWGNTPSPCPELKEKGSAAKAACESSRRIRHNPGLPWVSTAGAAADVQQTTHVTSSPAREGTQPGQAVPSPCSQAHAAASTSQPGETPGTGTSGHTLAPLLPLRVLSFTLSSQTRCTAARAVLAAARGHCDSESRATGQLLLSGLPPPCQAGPGRSASQPAERPHQWPMHR